MLPTWTSEEVFFDGDEYFDRLLNDIDQAKNLITIEMYIFNDDMLGKKIAAHLIAAHQRGVKIQMIVDGIGSYDFFSHLHGVFAKKGIQVKMYNPLPFLHPFYGKITWWRKIELFTTRMLRLNKRNHRKIITIDEEIMFIGSFNITAEHTRYHLESPWKDMGLRVSGPNVKFAVLNFKKVWKLRDYYKYKKKYRHELKYHWRQFPLRLNQTLFMKQYFYKNFITKINQAKERIWFMTPYFIPKRRLIRSLGKAAQRGIDVRLLISSKTDVKIFRTLQFFYYSYLIQTGVKVYLYTDSILHAKCYILDDWMTIGTSNLNHRSFLHDLEVDLIVQEEKNMKKVANHFLESTTDENSITMNYLNQRPLVDRLLSRLFFLFKYWF
jgi:cardiolipin synthase A/B